MKNLLTIAAIATMMASTTTTKSEPTVQHSDAVRAQKRKRHLQPVNPELCTKAFPTASKLSLVQEKRQRQKLANTLFPSTTNETLAEHNTEFIRRATTTTSWAQFTSL